MFDIVGAARVSRNREFHTVGAFLLKTIVDNDRFNAGVLMLKK